ncbi:MAG: RecX family transcriptional regulator [Firmicutes bacterium]|nr:RecX family transcriptional regulator [Bacillota bacterium]
MLRPLKPVTNKQAALDAAIRALTFRALTEQEIEQKLNKRSCPNEIIQEVIQYLKSYGYLNDEKLASAMVDKLTRDGKHGRNGIMGKMRQRGIPEAIVQQTIQVFDPKTEVLSAIAVARKKMPHYNIQDKLKLCRFLANKGFSTSVITRVCVQLENEQTNG